MKRNIARVTAALVVLALLVLAFWPGAVSTVRADVTGLDSLTLTGNLVTAGNAAVGGNLTVSGTSNLGTLKCTTSNLGSISP